MMMNNERQPVFQLAVSDDNAVSAALQRCQAQAMSARLWARDPDLWTGRDEGRWLGWLDAPNQAVACLADLENLAAAVRADGIRHVLLLGMGGSSLGAEVLGACLPERAEMSLQTLDSTDPRMVAAVTANLDPARTLFIVASKSGSTLEVDLFLAHFWSLACQALGEQQAARHFVAITDPGSRLMEQAKTLGFRRIFEGDPEIGGRYSVLSSFGLVPGAILGVDLGRLLDGALAMARACGPGNAVADNPGVRLGVAIATLAQQGRDKLTLITSPSLISLGGWLEQLIAESTGKAGKGVIPVDLEPLGGCELYGQDRVFVYLGLKDEENQQRDATLSALAAGGHPVIRLELADIHLIGAEFFRWQIATAAIGAVLGVHAFDQPDVEAAKIGARTLMQAFERTGELPEEEPLLSFDGIKLFAAGESAVLLARSPDFETALSRHLSQMVVNDYWALLAYLPRNPAIHAALTRIRTAVRDARHVATCLGFGPRFLHSTGQLHKGGPACGMFLQLTAACDRDVAVPGRRYGFGVVETAQARGDFDVLAARGRRLLRLHLGKDIAADLARLERAIVTVLT